MEHNSECKHCRTWEEEMYWKYFTSIHFSLTLSSHFHDHLVLPDKFSAHMKDQLPGKVSLKGPSGAMWDIELLKSNDLVFVGNEWKDFVKANGLKENCLLVFKYERNSGFEVLVFDQGSCEMESAYFAKNCKHDIKSNQEDQKKRVVPDNGEDEASFVASKKPRKDDEAEVFPGEKENASTLKKVVPFAVAKRKGRPRKQQAKFAENSIINEKDKVVSQTSRRDMTTPESEGSYLKKDESHKSEAQSRKSLSGNDKAEAFSRKNVAISAALKTGGRPRTRRALSIARKRSFIKTRAKEVSHNSHIDVIVLEDGETYFEKDVSRISRAQSKKQQNLNVTTSELREVSNMNLIPIEDGERSPVIDYTHNLEAQSALLPSKINTSREVCLTAPVNRKISGLKYYSRRPKGQAGKKPNSGGIAKMIRADYRGSFSENGHSSKHCGKLVGGRPMKQVVCQSSKKLVFKSASQGKRSCRKVVSNRRHVTETEKANALQRANQLKTEDSFTVVIRPSCVYPRFFMHVPAKWLRKHPLRGNQEVVLRVGEKTWRTTYFSYLHSRGLGTGWKNFVLDNLLEEFDVLVFKPVSLEDEAAVLDVDISKVV